jgi:WD40 repeat protein
VLVQYWTARGPMTRLLSLHPAAQSLWLSRALPRPSSTSTPALLLLLLSTLAATLLLPWVSTRATFFTTSNPRLSSHKSTPTQVSSTTQDHPNTSLTRFTELTTITFHPDGHLLAAGAVPAASPAPISAVSFSENGTWLASAHQNQTSAIVWDLRKLNQLVTLDVGTAVTGLTWDYTGQFLAACGPGGVVVNQYEKKSKSWSEPLRRAVKAVGVQWGSKAKSLVALTSEGAVSVLA